MKEGLQLIGEGWAMKPIEVRLPEKSKPRVTVGRKATDRRRNGDGWVAEAKLETFRMQHTSLPPVAFPMR